MLSFLLTFSAAIVTGGGGLTAAANSSTDWRTAFGWLEVAETSGGEFARLGDQKPSARLHGFPLPVYVPSSSTRSALLGQGGRWR